MAYSKNRKRNGIGREYRGRKGRDHDPRVQKIVDETVKDITEEIHKDYKDKIYNRHMVSQPDPRFDHPDLYKSSKYTPADKIAAVTAYMVTGNTKKATKYCGVPSSTIDQWKKTEWWATLTQQVKKEKNDELDAQLTAILHMALDETIDRLENGDTYHNTRTGESYKMPINSKVLVSITDRLFDKRQLLRGDVTSRSEKVSTDQKLAKLKQQFEQFSNAKDITGESEVIEDE